VTDSTTALNPFHVHDPQSAPEASRAILEQARQSYGFIPNLLGVLSGSPVALEAYTTLSEILEGGTLSAAERQVVLLTVSVANRCVYCVGAHSALAARAGVPQDAIDAIRAERPIDDARLGPLSAIARLLVEQRGWLGEAELETFTQAGFAPEQILEVVTALALETISNYTNHLAETPLDGAFAATSWTPPEEA
jgi:uncharacterized peroxidase-related enzyme